MVYRFSARITPLSSRGDYVLDSRDEARGSTLFLSQEVLAGGPYRLEVWVLGLVLVEGLV